MSTEAKHLNDLISKSLTGTKPYYIAGTSLHSGLDGYAIKANTETIIESIDSNCEGDTLVGETIYAGDIWYLNIQSLKLTSGSVFVYRH